MALAKHRVEVALATWEPRIDIKSVAVDGRRWTIAWTSRSTTSSGDNTFYNFVYPFYLIEGDGS